MGTPAPTGIEALSAPSYGAYIAGEMSYDPNRRPGSGGRRYFTDVEYVSDEGGSSAMSAAEARQAAQVAELMERNIRTPLVNLVEALPPKQKNA